MATRQIVLEIPEGVLLAEKIDETAFARELHVLAAVKLYELGRLSSGRAAELAGMSRVEFLLTSGRYKVFPLVFYRTWMRTVEPDRVLYLAVDEETAANVFAEAFAQIVADDLHIRLIAVNMTVERIVEWRHFPTTGRS